MSLRSCFALLLLPLCAASALAQVKNPLFAADQRILAATVPSQGELAQPMQISLQLAPGEISRIEVCGVQDARRWTDTGESNWVGGHEIGCGRPADVISEDGTTKTIEFVPLELGLNDVFITVTYADGGQGIKVGQSNILSSAKGLTSFKLSQGASVIALDVGCRSDEKECYEGPSVMPGSLQYVALRAPIYLRDPHKINFHVDQPEDAPVIQVDDDGVVRALRPGEVILVGTFAGVQARLTVKVHTREDRPPR